MIAARLLLSLCACCAAFVPFVAPQAQERADADRDPIPPPPRGLSLQWEGERGPLWQALIDAFAAATGNVVLIDERSERELALNLNPGTNNVRAREWIEERLRTVESLAARRSLEVPPEEVYPVFEAHLCEADFVLLHVAPGLVRVTLESQLGDVGKIDAIDVPAERLDACRRHPATTFRAWVPLAHATADRAADFLRRLVADHPRKLPKIVPAGPGAFVLGLGPDAANLADALREIDARVGRGEELDGKALRSLLEAHPPNTHDDGTASKED